MVMELIKRSNFNIQIKFEKIWPYLLILLFVISYYYFFTEKLPWFWYDDIIWLELAEETSPIMLIKEIFNFAPEDIVHTRPIIPLFMKFCNFLFSKEDPHRYRIIKILIFSLTLFLMFHLIVKRGGNTYITFFSLLVFASFPQVLIVISWVNEAAAFELFFKVSSFIVLFRLISEAGGRTSTKFIIISGILFLLIIFADKSKATAKIIPFLFLAYLFLTKNKKPLLYTVVFLTVFVIFPYSILYSAGAGSYFRAFHTELFKTFLYQIWPLLAFVCIMIMLVKKKGYFKNGYILFFILWLLFEIIFYAIYPSNEMRYLFSSLAAATALLSLFTSASIARIETKKNKNLAKLGFTALMLYLIFMNANWSYQFRGSSTAMFIIADKKMKSINQKFKNTLCL